MTPQQLSALQARFPEVLLQEPMSKHTTFRLGGPADAYVVARTTQDVLDVLAWGKVQGVNIEVIGGGTNTLAAAQGVRGVVVQLATQTLSIEGTRMVCDAGVLSVVAARKSVEVGLTGFEWAVGLPGTIGGATYGNAGCYGAEMKDSVVEVLAYECATGEVKRYSNSECGFGYRESRFKHEPHVILQTTLELAVAKDVQASRDRLQEILASRKEHQPLGASSAGCAFKNFEFTSPDQIAIAQRSLTIPEAFLVAKRIPAGWLIDQAGLKGKKIGGFSVSDKHANFLINDGTGTADDVLALMSFIKMRLRDDLGVQLQDEVQLLGF